MSKSSKPKLKKPLGGTKTDEQGNRTWVWGENQQVDTAVVKALGEDLSLTDHTPGEPASLDPYDRGAPPAKKPDDKRRTLDDMRRLSEMIKKNKKPEGDGS